eukprot:COSAG01_NODE_31429_length_597_cov_17.176724_1_plen_77_part_01
MASSARHRAMRMSTRPELLLAHLLPLSTSEHHHVHLQRPGHPLVPIAPPNSPAHASERKNSAKTRSARCHAVGRVTC